MRQIYILIILIILSSSCVRHFGTNELYGVYTPDKFVNTIDSIILKPNKVYTRKIYDKNNKLVFKTNGRWQLNKEGHILFSDFYLNLDQDISKNPELLNDPGQEFDVVIESSGGRISFCTGYYVDTNCYFKR